MKLSRYARSARSRATAAAVVLGVSKYQPRYDLAAQTWDAEYAAGVLDHYGAFVQQARYSALVGYLETLAPNTILDVGCGVGLLRERVEHLAFKHFTGIDPSEIAIEKATNRGYDRTTFAVGTEPNGERYDAIVCNEMLYYAADLDHLLEVLSRSLTDGGRLLTSVYKHPGDFALHHRLGKTFRLVDAVDVRNTVSGHRWKLACYRPTPGLR